MLLMQSKKLSLLAVLFILTVGSFAQTTARLPQDMIDSSEFKSLLFNTFVDGVVLMKSKKVEKAPLNYNATHQSINFISAGKYYTLTGLEDVDTIYIQPKKFVPVKNDIYEVISIFNKSTSLLASYTTHTRPLVATSDHNGTNKQVDNQVSNTVSDVYVSRNYKGNSSIELQRHFWVKVGETLYKADTKAQIRKAFPTKSKGEIDNYINANNINLLVESNVISLMEFMMKR